MKTDYQEALIFLKNRGWLIQTTLVGKKVKFTTYKDEQPLVINGEANISNFESEGKLPESKTLETIISESSSEFKDIPF